MIVRAGAPYRYVVTSMELDNEAQPDASAHRTQAPKSNARC